MSAQNNKAQKYAYVGCFTTEMRKAHGKGISVYSIDDISGAWTLVQLQETLINPGFLALHPSKPVLYTVHGSATELSAYAIDPSTGKLSLLNRQPTDGNNSPHLTMSPDARHVLVANGPGVAVFPINTDGTLAPHCALDIPPGEPGPHRHHQKGPHPHQVVFDATGRYIAVPDKGLDRVHVYAFDAASGKIGSLDAASGTLKDGPMFSIKSRSCAAPRHLVFHPQKPLVYVINELNSTITGYHWNVANGELKPFQVITSLPTTHIGDNTGGEIAVAPSGKFIYVSNRGHDSIGIYAVDLVSGILSPVGWESTRGNKPRFFALDDSGEFLYVCNINSDTIVVFKVDRASGKLTATGQVIDTLSSCCIVFADFNARAH